MTNPELTLETEEMTTEAPASIESDLIYGLESRPPLIESIFVALQHVFACFVGIITPGFNYLWGFGSATCRYYLYSQYVPSGFGHSYFYPS